MKSFDIETMADQSKETTKKPESSNPVISLKKVSPPHENITVFVIEDEKNTTKNSFGAPEISAIGSILTVIVSLALAYITIKKFYIENAQNKLQREDFLKDKAVEKAKIKIEKFYGPINSLLEESRIIYEHFALTEKAQNNSTDKRFRTLRHFTELPIQSESGIERLKPHDKALWSHILDISDRIIILIEKDSGYIDNPSLHTLLGKLAAHYRIVKSASEGSLAGQAAQLENVVFPLEVNGAINSEIQKLLNTINEKKPSTIEKSKTITYYDKNYLEYYKQTIDNSFMKPIYEQVLCHIPYGANILDAGCGVGRDTKKFIRSGFKVTSFDASEKMVDMCNSYPFSFCELESFESIQYRPDFDLVWACASLLHLEESKFKSALLNLTQSLKNGGIIYFSLKSNVDEEKSNGRDFFVHKYTDVMTFLKTNLKMKHVNSWSSYSVLSPTETFENYIFRK